jgi:hypothetical protein
MDPTPQTTGNDVGPGRKLVGGLLIAAGLLIGGLGGLCSVVFEGSLVMSTFRMPHRALGGLVGMLFLPIFLGAFPVAIGLGLFVAGRSLLKPAPRRHPRQSF